MEIEKIGMISSVPKVGDTGAYAWHHAQNCLLYGVARCPLFRDCLSIEVNGRTFRISITRLSRNVHAGQPW